jgi:dipeptidyl aminopeptidase/acylaminoacyl peptidase
MMNSDGTNQRNITKDPGNCYGPDFSPDGTRIAYTRIAANGTLEIWTMDPDGSNRVNVTASAPGDNSDPSWSPDGSKLAFSSKRTAQMGVYVIDADGSDVTARLSDVNEWSSNPSWSPDGSRLAYESIRTGTTNISTVNVDGSNVTKITNRPAADTEPAWSPDGHHVLFMSRADGDFDLWMVDPDGSNLGHLTDHPGDELYGAWESVNHLPSAVDDGGYTVQPGGMLTGSSVLANDHDPDGDALVAKLETPPSMLRASISPRMARSSTAMTDQQQRPIPSPIEPKMLGEAGRRRRR